MTGLRIHAFILALVVAASASAMDTPKPEPKDPDKKDAQLEQARAAIARQDWTGAQAILRAGGGARAAERRRAQPLRLFDAQGPAPRRWTWCSATTTRRCASIRSTCAAREYLGEAYLMTGNVAKAKDLLAELDRLCKAGCVEQAELKRSISTFERQHAAK